MSEVIGWAETSENFGSALPNGSCSPRKSDGTCLRGHHE